jgi:hypothetical protein
MSIHGLARTALILLPLTTCAARLQSHAISPGALHTEMIRCLRVVSLASRRARPSVLEIVPGISAHTLPRR